MQNKQLSGVHHPQTTFLFPHLMDYKYLQVIT